jgi:integrase
MPRRRARGEGAVYFDRSRGRWTGQLSIWDGGRRRRLTVHGRTRAEAARKLAELRAKLATGYPLLAERLTL